ncbi:MAG: hypothetical protein AMXMBFR59_34380 [Rhodanobacteraceae bacterium]
MLWAQDAADGEHRGAMCRDDTRSRHCHRAGQRVAAACQRTGRDGAFRSDRVDQTQRPQQKASGLFPREHAIACAAGRIRRTGVQPGGRDAAPRKNGATR